PCYEDKVARIGIRICDYLEPGTFKRLVAQNLKVRAAELTRVKPLSAITQDVFADYDGLRRFIAPFCVDTSALLDEALDDGKRVLLESAQGAMLDLDFGTYPFVTSSNPISGGACTGAGIPPRSISTVLGVSKAYTTRVGLGPFPTELDGRVASFIREVGKEYGTTTGRPRRIGWLDLPQLRAAMRVSGMNGLAMTKLDTLSGIHPIKVCVGYRYQGTRLDAFPISRKAQFEVEPIYESFPGFSGDLSTARRFKDLPPGARDYVLQVEKWLKLPIPMVSVGQSREQTIIRDKKWLRIRGT
ncbi:MAG: adenylosuccinate synthetase, partial [Elusimicrobia bacterium]|nr:adenylosuccinate synthetase [Elusimicrobiota bacterium]